MNFIDIPELMRQHPFVREGVAALEDCYRDWQGWTARGAAFSRDASEARRGYAAAKDMLVRQVSRSLDLPADDVDSFVIAFLINRCGTYTDPKGYDAWDLDEVRATLT